MQNLSLRAPAAPKQVSSQSVFGFACCLLVAVCAILAGTSPVWFTMAAFCVFGVPHNYAEFRYFLYRLPSRFGPLKSFFIVSCTGLVVLSGLQALTICMMRSHFINRASLEPIILVWNELLIFWIFALSLLRYPRHARRLSRGNLLIVVFASIANLISPDTFSLCISYLHPLIGLWVLDRELLRNRKLWVKTYRLCLLLIPLSMILITWKLHFSAIPDSGSETLIRDVGSLIFASALSPVYVGLFAFLQMIHYGIWTIAIPIASEGWWRWRLERLPVLRDRVKLARAAACLVSLGMLVVILSWIGLKLDFIITNQIYATIATIHIIAEIPLLFWMCEGRR